MNETTCQKCGKPAEVTQIYKEHTQAWYEKSTCKRCGYTVERVLDGLRPCKVDYKKLWQDTKVMEG